MNKTNLLKLVALTKPSSFLDYRNYLETLFLILKKNVDGYTYQKFALDLGHTGTNVLSHIIKGRRPLSTAGAEKIATALKFRAIERRYLLLLVDYCNSGNSAVREELFTKLIQIKEELLPEDIERDQLEYFTEWYHPVIGEMTRLPDFQSDPNWIAATIVPKIRPEQARKSLELLEKLNIIQYDKQKGRHIRSDTNPSTGHETKGVAVARFHQRMIEHGREATTRFTKDERDISGITLCLSEQGAKKIKGLVHAFQMQVLAEESKELEKNRIYQMNIQLFPFTKGSGRIKS